MVVDFLYSLTLEGFEVLDMRMPHRVPPLVLQVEDNAGDPPDDRVRSAISLGQFRVEVVGLA